MEPVRRETLIADAAPGENHRQNPAERLPVDQECVIRLHASVIQYKSAIILRGENISILLKRKIVGVNWVPITTVWRIHILLTEERLPI